MHYKNFFYRRTFHILESWGLVSPTVEDTFRGGIERKRCVFVVEGQQPQGAADEEGGGGEDGSAL